MLISQLDSVNVLLRKSEMFLKSAKGNLARKLYDIACFDADQATQLYLKAHVLKFSGLIPRTHSLRTLLSHLASATNVNKSVIHNFVAEHRSDIIMLEDAYIRSRYFGEEFNMEDAIKCIEIAEKVMDLVRRSIINP